VEENEQIQKLFRKMTEFCVPSIDGKGSEAVTPAKAGVYNPLE